MKMKATIEPLKSRAQTGRSIYESAKYYKDLGLHLDTGLQDFFNFVKKIPYKEDKLGLEVVSRPEYLLLGRSPHKIIRPKYILGESPFPNGIDCKKKAVLISAWLEAHGIPYRLCAVSEKKNKKIHHVFPQAEIEGKWYNVDATYPYYKLFEGKNNKVTHGEILPR